jgi:hypothetical protein
MRDFRIIILTVLSFGAIPFSCHHSTRNGNNQFSLSADTLHIKTFRMKGTGVFDFSGGVFQLQDTADLFDYAIEKILDKFQITDWKKYLPKLLDK